LRHAPLNWHAIGCLGDYLVVIAAAVASFVFGGVWYNVLSKQWLEAVGRQPERTHERGGVGLYVLALVGQLVMAWMLAGILLHLAKGGLPLGTKPS
jgi:hypothetical protein